ncbi:MAG: GntR family transcriptional regulator [Vicinamibacteria bacterium]
MDIVLNRKGGGPVRDQIRAQIELKILGGELAGGARLPSVRSLARRLCVHANTISAAYQELQAAGHLELKQGSGVFVRPTGPPPIEEARGLDEMIRIALQTAFDRGYSGEEVRAAVGRWLAAAPPDRVVVVDPSRTMAEVLAHELKRTVGVPVSARTLEDVTRDPAALSGALAVVLPHNLQALSALRPGMAVEAVNLEVASELRDSILALPQGTIALIVSHAASVLPFASILFRSLRGDDLLVEPRLLTAAEEWQRLVKAADVVYADALSARVVQRFRPRRLVEVRFLAESAHERLRETLAVVVPRT